ncbi:ATP synthase subunit I [Flavobacterium sp. W21_SRS_FM6]|uniref:ATP synthase subunit I n=1 Tax=Flavobacterium sp. W21_SRS_FM6 TaxID=3240268 RepID=UPI003F91FA1B
MAVSLVLEGQKLARKVIIYQSILAIVIALFFTFYGGKNSGLSAAYGAVSVILPSMIYAYFAFRYAGARQNKLVVRSFNKGSKIKFILTIVLFVFIYRWQNVDIMALMVSFTIVLLGQWPIIILVSRVKKTRVVER